MARMTAEEEEIYNYKWGVAPYDTPEGRAAAPKWLIGKMAEEGFRPQSPAGRPAGAKSPTTRTPAQRFLSNWAPWGMGTLGLGIVLVIIAVFLHDHYALPNAVCNSSLGQLGQAFSGTAYTACSTASTAESAVGPLVFTGVLALLVGGGKMLLALVGAALLTKETAPADSRGPQASFPPAAAVTTPRPGSPPAGVVTTPRPGSPPAAVVTTPRPSSPSAGVVTTPGPGSPLAGVVMTPRPSSPPAAVSASAAAATGNAAAVTASPAQPPTAAPRLFCTRCGKRGASGDRFCGGCGATMNTLARS